MSLTDSPAMHYPTSPIKVPRQYSHILLTHPGKIGDLIWALSAAREVARKYTSGQVDLATSPYCRGLIPLLEHQEWIGSAIVLENWNVIFSAPVVPVIPPPYFDSFGNPLELRPVCGGPWDFVAHLGMRCWPSPTLLEYYPNLLRSEYGLSVEGSTSGWLEARTFPPSSEIAICFSDEWVELKAGLCAALATAFPLETFRLLVSPQSRLAKEFRFPFQNFITHECDIVTMADFMASSKLLVTCNSAPHPLANALGVPTVVVEPSTPRHQEVFKSRRGKNVYHDGFDAREVVGVVGRRLEELK